MAGRRCAEWRFPTEKQQRKEAMERRLRREPADPARSDDDCWWDAVLSDPRAAAPSRPTPDRQLGDIPQARLRVECLRCMRVVDIRRDDAIGLYGAGSIWRSVGQRLLDDDCPHRTGRHEEDGCWPDFNGF
jgi:hypothetical protein